MNIPQRIQKGFNYEEAVLMAKFCQRVYYIFQQDDGSIDDEEIKDIYNAMYRNEDWKIVYTFRNDDKNIRGFIVKRSGENQYAIVLRGSVLTNLGSLELTDFIHDLNAKLIGFEGASDKRTKIIEGNWIAFNSIKNELLMFFKILAIKKIEDKDLKKFEGKTYDEKYALGSALASAAGILFGADLEQKIREVLSQALEHGNFDDLELKLQQVIKSNSIELTDDIHKTPMDIYITGHSLGGAMSVLCAPILKRYLNKIENFDFKLKVYTVGAPKGGNKHFINFYDNYIGKDFHYRIENVLDPVVHLPLPPPFPLNIFAANGFRIGDIYFSECGGVGRPHTLFGLGNANASLDFGGALQIPGGIPFPHSFDGYVEMLEEDKQRSEDLWRPIEGFLGSFLKDMLFDLETEIGDYIKEQIQPLRKAIEDLQLEVKELKNSNREKN